MKKVRILFRAWFSQIIASHVAPDDCLPELTQLAKDITVALALHLADLVASFLTGVLDGQAVLLFGTGTSALLQASYWVRPIYEELLYASSHSYQGPDVEARRASNGLAKIVSGKVGSADQPPQTASPLTVLGQSLNASVLQIWFPAHWSVRAASRIRALGGTDPEFRAEHVSYVPNVRCSIKLPQQSLNVEHLLPGFPTVFHGIVCGVFRQQAGGAWFPSKILKIHITVIMPQSSEPHHWFTAVAGREGSWPMELPNPRPLLRPISLRTFSRMRHRALSPHLWGSLVPDWAAGSNWLYLETPTVETERQIRQKFEARNNQNLVDRFAKPHERAAHMPRWRAANAELASFRGYNRPTFDMNVRAFLASVVARDLERGTLRMHVLGDASSSLTL